MFQLALQDIGCFCTQQFAFVDLHSLTSFSLFTENVFPCPASELIPITHWEVGKYFCKFVGNRYVPNVALKQIYEQDVIE